MGKSMNNRNSSPPEEEENYEKNSQFISEDIEQLDKTLEILHILEEEGLIDSVKYDRTDDNTDKEHFHIYYNTNINHNSLTQIVNDYVNHDILNDNKIEKEKIKMAQKEELKLYGVLNRKVVGLDSTNSKVKKLIKETENDMIFLIAKDKDGVPVHKPFSGNTGLKPKPSDLLDSELMKDSKYHTLQGKYDFTYTFNQEVDKIEDIVKSAKESVLESIGDKYDTSLIDLKVSVKGNELTVSFNNLLVDKQNSDKLYMISSKNMNFKNGGLQEVILKKLSEKINTPIKTQKVAIWKDEENRRTNLEYKLKQESNELNEKLKTVDKKKREPKVRRSPKEEDVSGTYKEVEETQNEIKDETLLAIEKKISEIQSKIDANNEKLSKLEGVREIADVEEEITKTQTDISSDTELLNEVNKEKELHLQLLEEQSKQKEVDTSSVEVLSDTKHLDFIKEVKSINSVEELDSRIKDIENKLSKLNEVSEYADVSKDIKDWEEKLSIVTLVKTDLENDKKLEEENNKLSSQVKDLSSKVEKTLQVVEEKTKTISVLEDTLQTKDSQIDELSKKVTEIVSTVQTLNENLTKKDSEIVKLSQSLSTVQKTVQTLNDSITKKDGEITKLSQSLITVEKTLSTVKTELGQYREREQGLISQVKTQTDRADKSDKALSEVQSKFNTVSSENKVINEKLGKLEKKTLETLDSYSKLERETTAIISDLTSDKEELSTKITQLEEEVKKSSVTRELSSEDMSDLISQSGKKYRTIEEPTDEDDDIIEVQPVNKDKLEVKFEDDESQENSNEDTDEDDNLQ